MRQTRRTTPIITGLPSGESDDAATRRLSAAGDPLTDPAFLQELGAGDDAAVCEAVAANPNTPWETLRLLAPRYPQAFFANLVLPLLLLANPQVFHDFTEEAILLLLAQETLPTMVLGAITTYPGDRVRMTIASHVQLHGEIEAGWDGEAAAMIKEREFTVLYIDYIAYTRQDLLEWFLNQAEHAAPWLLEILAQHANATIRAVVASNMGITIALQERLLADTCTAVHCSLATNPTTNIRILEQLACKEDSFLKRNLAANPSLPPALLTQLADDEDQDVRMGVAANPQTPIAVLEHLAANGNSAIQVALASSPSTPLPILNRLAKDKRHFIIESLAQNPQTPPHVLEAISRHWHWQLRRAVGANPLLPLAAIERLAADKHAKVRTGVAANPRAPASVLAKLAKSRIEATLLHVAGNPQTPHKILEKLVKRELTLCVAALQNRAITDEMRRRWYSHLLQIFASKEMYSLGEEDVWRMFALTSTMQSPAVLTQHAQQEGDWVLRFIIARNPTTPAATLAMLAHDGNRYVRAAARAALAT